MRRLASLLLLFILCTASAQETLLEDVTSFYPRLVRLAANGSANGRLIASFDVIGVGHIYQSTNDGLSWSQIATISESQYANTCCSELYELPQTLGSTAAGTLFWAVSATMRSSSARSGSSRARRRYTGASPSRGLRARAAARRAEEEPRRHKRTHRRRRRRQRTRS